jgi:hypothetical protein
MGGQDAVVAVPVLPGRRGQDGEAIQKLDGLQIQQRLAVGAGFRQVVDEALVGGDPGQPLAGVDLP